MPKIEECIPAGDVARQFGISLSSLYHACFQGRVPHVRAGRSHFIDLTPEAIEHLEYLGKLRALRQKAGSKAKAMLPNLGGKKRGR